MTFKMTCCGCCCKGGVAGSCLGSLWMFMSFLTTCVCCVSFYLPYWLQGTMSVAPQQVTNGQTLSANHHNYHHDNGNVINTYFGIWRRCNFLRAENNSIHVAMECGRYASFLDIPSLWWQIGTVAMGTGCGVLVLVLLFNLLGCCCNDVITTTSSRICAYLQLLAALLLGSGLALYPLGWRSTEVKRVCGHTADFYDTGSCDIIWGMWVAIGGAGAAILCSILGCSVASSSRKPSNNRPFRQSRDNYMHVSTQ